MFICFAPRTAPCAYQSRFESRYEKEKTVYILGANGRREAGRMWFLLLTKYTYLFAQRLQNVVFWQYCINGRYFQNNLYLEERHYEIPK